MKAVHEPVVETSLIEFLILEKWPEESNRKAVYGCRVGGKGFLPNPRAAKEFFWGKHFLISIGMVGQTFTKMLSLFMIF